MMSIFFSILERPKRAGSIAVRIPRGLKIFHGPATGLFSDCPLRRFGYIFIANFALSERVVNINRIIISSTSVIAKYQYQISFLASSIKAVFTYLPRLPLSPLLQLRRLIFTFQTASLSLLLTVLSRTSFVTVARHHGDQKNSVGTSQDY